MFGETPAEQRPVVESISDSVAANAAFHLYPGIGHRPVAFFSRARQQINRQLRERYRVEEVLGHGGMGVECQKDEVPCACGLIILSIDQDTELPGQIEVIYEVAQFLAEQQKVISTVLV